ncbi:MAG: hypothetical protein KGQ41_02500 [Alphaproteobacteria bacterium]|nr:hypothetical protein [Alphaproteobacteria bacterium]
MSDILNQNISHMQDLRDRGRSAEADALIVAFARAANRTQDELVKLAQTFQAISRDYAAKREGKTAHFMRGQAFDMYERAALMDTNNADLALDTAKAALEYAFRAAAFRHTRRALDNDIGNAEAWSFLGKLLDGSGEAVLANACRDNAQAASEGRINDIDRTAKLPQPKVSRP